MANTYTLISSNVLTSSAASVTEYDFTFEDVERYLIKKIVTEDGCWILNTNRTYAGYTTFHKKRVKRMAHRVMWVLTNGEIPIGMDVDHMCHNLASDAHTCNGGLDCRHRACFNPDHLRVATRSENIGSGSKKFFSKQTCSKGHSREPINVRYRPNGQAFCWTCHKKTVMLYKRRKKAEAK